MYNVYNKIHKLHNFVIKTEHLSRGIRRSQYTLVYGII